MFKGPTLSAKGTESSKVSKSLVGKTTGSVCKCLRLIFPGVGVVKMLLEFAHMTLVRFEYAQRLLVITQPETGNGDGDQICDMKGSTEKDENNKLANLLAHGALQLRIRFAPRRLQPHSCTGPFARHLGAVVGAKLGEIVD